MSLIPENDKYYNTCQSYRFKHPPPVRRLFSQSDGTEQNVEKLDLFQVFLRLRPNPGNYSKNDPIKIVDANKIVCKPPETSKAFYKGENIEYIFSHIFGPEITQQELFNQSVLPCIENLLNSRNSLIFSYGTTNAGKTYTVQGDTLNPGIIPRSLHAIFSNIQVDQKVTYAPHLAKNVMRLSSKQSKDEIQQTKDIIRLLKNSKYYSKSMENLHNEGIFEYSQVMKNLSLNNMVELQSQFPLCSVWISFVELYNESLYDLLEPIQNNTRKQLKIGLDKYRNLYIKEMKQVCVLDAEEAYAIYQFGQKNLTVASTKLNHNSSRSHCIFIIKLINQENSECLSISSLSICDLAGTERQAKTQNEGIRLKETSNINLSLFVLNRCLRILKENLSRQTTQVMPYRQSLLTRLFQSALVENEEKIVMIVNIIPSVELYDETQQVLKMCAIASEIKMPHPTSLQPLSSILTYDYTEDEDIDFSDFDYENIDDDDEEMLQELIKDLKSQLEKKEDQLKEKEQQIKDLHKLYDDLLRDQEKTQDELVRKMLKDQKESRDRFVKSIKEDYETKIEKLKNVIEEEYVRKSLVESCAESFNIQNNLCNNELNELKIHNSNLEQEIEKLKCEIEDIQKKSTVRENVQRKMLHENMNLKDKLQEKIENEKIMNDKFNTLSLEIEKKNAEIRNMKKTIEKLAQLDVECFDDKENCLTNSQKSIDKKKKKLFSSPLSNNCITDSCFDSNENYADENLKFDEIKCKSRVATPAQTVKYGLRKRLN